MHHAARLTLLPHALGERCNHRAMPFVNMVHIMAQAATVVLLEAHATVLLIVLAVLEVRFGHQRMVGRVRLTRGCIWLFGR